MQATRVFMSRRGSWEQEAKNLKSKKVDSVATQLQAGRHTARTVMQFLNIFPSINYDKQLIPLRQNHLSLCIGTAVMRGAFSKRI
jgi:hypothetical protein